MLENISNKTHKKEHFKNFEISRAEVNEKSRANILSIPPKLADGRS